MTDRIELLTPVGRLVQGSLYEPTTTDAEGNPLTVKNGPNAGQPRVEYFFSLAIRKGTEQHWMHTEWGAKIYQTAQQAFPNGQAQSPAFAWKVTDGDSQVPNRKGRKPCDREGFAGHWVLSFKAGFAPQTFSKVTGQLIELPQKDAINLGDYIQVYGSISGNNSQQQPGIFLNHKFVALMGYGERIISGPDPESVGFGGPLPPGASPVPLAGIGVNIADTNVPLVAAVPSIQPVTPQQPVPPPYPQILTPPAVPAMPPITPPQPVRKLTAKAAGFTYEQLVAEGWNDQLLIQHGYMEP
jgi:hypothetical protein